jgi:glycosyltransferase involved in cell wall biosynthesis
MRICLTCPFYLPFWGGVERHVDSLSGYLASRGHEVYVFTSKMIEPLLRTSYDLFIEKKAQPLIEKINGYTIRRFEPTIVMPKGKLATYQFLFQYYHNLRKFLRFNTFDVLHGHEISWGGMAVFADRERRTRHVITIHTNCYPKRNRFLKHRIGVSIFRMSDKIIVINKEAENDVYCYGVQKEKVLYIPNWVDTKVFKPTVQKHSKLWGEYLILFVGRMVEYKGIPLILNAVKRLVEKGIKIKAVFIGVGPDLPSFQEMVKIMDIEKNVEFLVRVSLNELVDNYSKADVFVLPSRYEGQGKVLLEAMSCGTPVIAYNAGGMRETVTPEVGILLKQRTATDLERALHDILIDDKRRALMARKARKRAETVYDINVILPKVEKAYQSLL